MPFNRREALVVASLGAFVGSFFSRPTLAAPMRLLLVHGRAQIEPDFEVIKAAWLKALKKGAEDSGHSLPSGLEVAFPYYGPTLDKFSAGFDVPLTADIHTKGGPGQDEFLKFQAELAEEVRRKARITEAQVNDEYGNKAHEKGPSNWEWVQAIMRAIDKYGGGMSQKTLDLFTRDVFLYTRRAGVRSAIDKIVGSELTEEPTVVIAHSLGSIVAYNILRSDLRHLNIPLFVTVGCPLGIRAVRSQLQPLVHPEPVKKWFNAYDDRDVVALYPLDGANFPVEPAIENYGKVDNSTKNRHGISGYLDNKVVAERVVAALGT